MEMVDRILPLQLDETAGEAYRKLFEAAGCRFLLGKKATETVMNSSGAVETVILDDGTRIDCDLVLVAAGVVRRSSVSKTAASGGALYRSG